MLKTLDQILAKSAQQVIKIYQKTISPDHSWLGKLFPYHGCRFHPTCSEYCQQMLEQRGFFRGLGPCLLRIGKCNPWHPGGVDPVKPSKKAK